MNTKEIAIAIKKYLIDLAVNDGLLLDLNDLSISVLETVIDGTRSKYDEAIERAGGFLCEGENTVAEQVELIVNQAAIDSHTLSDNTMIDYVDGVIVWEKVENSFNCNAFLEYIDYVEKVIK